MTLKNTICITFLFFLLNHINLNAQTTFNSKPFTNSTINSIKKNILYMNPIADSTFAQVDSLISINQIKSAELLLEKMILNFQLDKNWSAYIRAVMTMSKIKSKEEFGFQSALSFLEAEIKKSLFPSQNILYSITAYTYAEYLNENQYKLGNIIEHENEDVFTWSIPRCLERIFKYYKLSIENEDLKNIVVSEIDLFTTKSNTDALRPTLFDFLSNEVLNYIKIDRHFIDEPINKFEINDEIFFSNYKQFISTNINSKDSLSRVFQGLLIYQKLLSYHMTLKDEESLRLLDLDRLTFVYQHSSHPHKLNHFLNALNSIINSKNNGAWKAEYNLKKINVSLENDRYSIENPTIGHKYLLSEAISDLEQIKIDYSNSKYEVIAQNIISRIKTTFVSLKSEKSQSPNKPFLMLAEYANITHTKLYFYKIDPIDYLKIILQKKNSENALLKSLPIYREVDIDLPTFDDFRTHRVEIKIEGFAPGFYIFFNLPFHKFSIHEVQSNILQVTNLCASTKNYSNNNLGEYLVTNKDSGEPLQKVNANIYTINKGQSLKLSNTSQSNKDGIININLPTKNNHFIIYQHGSEILADLNLHYPNDNHYNKSESQKIFSNIFTDRVIYRPGQILFFKTIIFEHNELSIPTILSNQKVKISLRNANDEIVTTATFTSNEFGSISGSFNIPSSGLLGAYQIVVDEENYKSIQIEEYKRPKFEIKIDSLFAPYQLNDTIKISGKSSYFAGIPNNNARVKYTVTRSFHHIYRSNYEIGMSKIYFPSNDQIISFGDTKTNENGAFDINFLAATDIQISKSENPNFVFKIHIEIMDESGESQSTSMDMILNNTKFQTNYQLPKNCTIQNFKNISIITLNCFGKKIKIEGNLKIEKLKSPTQYLKPKFYEVPEFTSIPKNEYKKMWPFEPYLDEMNVKTWQPEQTIFNATIQSNDDSIPALQKLSMKEGYYKITFSENGSSNQTFNNPYFILISKSSTDPLFELDKFLTFSSQKEEYEPGQIAILEIYSRNPSKKVLYEVYDKEKLVERNWINVAQLKQKNISISENHRGGIFVLLTAFGHNRVESMPLILKVPWSNKNLKIQLTTFRNKLSPGQDEEWEINILDQQNNVVKTEVLASLYDASLDQFLIDSYELIPFPIQNTELTFFDIINSSQNIYIYKENQFKDEKPIEWRAFRPELLIVIPQNRRYKALANESYAVQDANENLASNASEQSKLTETKKAPSKFNANAPLLPLRTNLKETAFFYPQLLTDENGNAKIKFKINEALTQWKFRLFAHTKDLKQVSIEKEIVTQKEIMIFPNLPRFIREKDEIELTAKIYNASSLQTKAQINLEILDSETKLPISEKYFLDPKNITVQIEKETSSTVKWKIIAPELPISSIIIRMSVSTENHTDGEENIIPIFTNKSFVTESLPFLIKKNESKIIDYKTKQNQNSETFKPFKYTLEYSSNPLWYAIQSLSYIMEKNLESTNQYIERFVANSLATHILDSRPNIKSIFDQLQATENLTSQLSKNSSLKSEILEETPWILSSKNETLQMKSISLLFNQLKIQSDQNTILSKIIERQTNNGGITWHPGSPESEYISFYVLENLAQLQKLGLLKNYDQRFALFLQNLIEYCDQIIQKKWNLLYKNEQSNPKFWKEDHLNYSEIQYLFARSYFQNINASFLNSEALISYIKLSQNHWNKKNYYAQAMIAFYLSNFNDSKTPILILEGLKQTAIQNKKTGTFWKTKNHFSWYTQPIESQAMMIQLFIYFNQDEQFIDDMKFWLLQYKQANHWGNTKATTSAIFSLILGSSTEALDTKLPEIIINNNKLDLNSVNPIPGIGYFTKNYSENEISKDEYQINVTNNSKITNWGSIYFQFFEQMDKINANIENPLNIITNLHIVSFNESGEFSIPITSKNGINLGDKIRIQTIIKADRDMEFVHLKIMQPAGTSPMEHLSGYQYQNGLGFYKNIKDIATHFYFENLPKGTHIFEYEVIATHKGNFTSGISTIQSMYAPEFLSHSKGSILQIK